MVSGRQILIAPDLQYTNGVKQVAKLRVANKVSTTRAPFAAMLQFFVKEAKDMMSEYDFRGDVRGKYAHVLPR